MRLVQTLLQTSGAISATTFDPLQPVARGVRLYIRLRCEDHTLLRERAASRGMAAATYASVLLRTHLRGVALLPERELAALKRSAGELGAIGRNLNQLARVANQTERVMGPSVQDLRALLRVCTALTDHIKELINPNTVRWNTGHAEARR